MIKVGITLFALPIESNLSPLNWVSIAFKQMVIRRKEMMVTTMTLMMKVAMTMTLLPTPPFLAPD